jgi:signal transduction histidine kinase
MACWLLCSTPVQALTTHPELALTAAERAWIAQHPVVRVGLTNEFPPYYFFDQHSRLPQGYVVEMLDLWSQRTGLQFEYTRHPTLAAVMQALAQGQVDLTPFTTPGQQGAPGRPPEALFTRPVLATQLVLAARRDVPDVSVTDGFGGRPVAVETGSSIEALVRARYPQARLLPFADVRSAVRALAAGQADLFIGYQHLIVYHVEKELLANVELRSTLGPGATPLGPAVSTRQPLLQSILDKAIGSVSTVDQSRLASRWLPAGSTAVRLPTVAADLTAAKRNWVEQHGRLRVGYDSSFAPITSGGALGDFRGLGAEIFKLAAQKVGLQVEQEVGGSFADIYQRGVAGDLDVVVGMARSPSRRQDYDFVGPFISTPTALVVAEDSPHLVTDTTDIGVRKLALLRDHFLIPQLRSRHPGITLVELDSQAQVLSAVAEGAAEVGLGNIQVIHELMQNRFAGRVRITGTVRDGDSELYLAVPRRLPELTQVLRDGLEAINDSEMATLRAQWLRVQVNGGPSWERLWQVGLPVVAVVGGYLFLLLRGNRRLRAARAQALHARAVAEESTAARGRFLAYLSHELRGALAGVASGADMLMKAPEKAADDSGLRQRLLAAIAQSVKGLRQVLDTTLAYEHAAQAPLVLQPTDTLLADWWAQCLAPLQLAAGERGQPLLATWDPQLPHRATLDGVRLAQVVQNLVGNALKFCPQGAVQVQASHCTLPGRQPGWRIEVLDEGPGLAEGEAEQIFLPYARGRLGQQDRHGAGLGLAISQQIVQAMGGRIGARQRPEGGACFWVELPGP